MVAAEALLRPLVTMSLEELQPWFEQPSRVDIAPDFWPGAWSWLFAYQRDTRLCGPGPHPGSAHLRIDSGAARHCAT